MITRRFSKKDKIDLDKLKKFQYISDNKVIPNNTTDWGANLLSNEWFGETGVGILTFDKPITNIPHQTFQNMTGKGYNLEAVTHIPESCKVVNNRAFQSNNTLLNVDFGDGVTTIGRFMFNGCRNLTTVRFGKEVKHIGTIDATSGSTTIVSGSTNDSGAFFGLCFDLSTIYWDCVSCNDFMKSNQTLFHHDSMIQGMYVDSYVGVSTVHLGRQVVNIPRMCFYGCEKLSSVIDIPNTCQRIGDYAFADCKALTKVYCRSLIPPKIESGYGLTEFDNGTNVVFKYYDAASKTYKVIPGLKVFVPLGCADVYKSDPQWKEYTNYIYEYYDQVDLGLRNSAGKKVLFASCNVGAKNPEDFGYIFSWGETTVYSYDLPDPNSYWGPNVTPLPPEYKKFNWGGYKYSSDGNGTNMTKYNATDKLTELQPADDGATTYMMDDNWRTPSAEDFTLLTDTTKVKKEYIDLNGNVVAPTEEITNLLGVRYTSLVPGYVGNSIFFPAGGTGVYDDDYGSSVVKNIYVTGSLWTRDLNTSNVKNARFFYYYTPSSGSVSQYARMYGRHIRGVVYK